MEGGEGVPPPAMAMSHQRGLPAGRKEWDAMQGGRVETPAPMQGGRTEDRRRGRGSPRPLRPPQGARRGQAVRGREDGRKMGAPTWSAHFAPVRGKRTEVGGYAGQWVGVLRGIRGCLPSNARETNTDTEKRRAAV